MSSFLEGGGPFNDEINRRFDVVSWDPREVSAGLEPFACGTEIAKLFLSIDLVPEERRGASHTRTSVAVDAPPPAPRQTDGD